MKIYSNQFILENTIPIPESGLIIQPDKWWFIFNYENKQLIGEPMQLNSRIQTPLSIFVSNTLEECEEYILSENLRLPWDKPNEIY